MNISNKTQPLKTYTLKEVAMSRGPEQLQSAIAAFANSCPRAVVDENGRELYRYPTPSTFLQHLYSDPQAVKALRVTNVDIVLGHWVLLGEGYTMPEWMADFHRLTAMALFGRSGSGVSKEERAKAKEHNFRFLYGGGVAVPERKVKYSATEGTEEGQIVDTLAAILSIPKERLRIVDKLHDDYIVALLPEERKGTIKVGKPEDFAKHIASGGGSTGAEKDKVHADTARGYQINEVHQVSRRVTQKLDKIKRALTNTAKDVEDIEAYLKEKLDGYRHER